MIRKLPKWVWFGAGGLSFNAGMINVVGLLGFEHQAVTHLTGTTSMLGSAVASFDGEAALRFSAVIGSFVLGTIVSGFVIRDTALQLGRRYWIALLLESVLLFAAVPLLHSNNSLGIYSASCACGLQNAMASTYSGTVVRTTHLSGMFTDLGILIGHSLRGLEIDRRKMRLYSILILGFLGGGIVGAVAFHRLGYSSLLIPATLTAITTIGYALQLTSMTRS